MLRIAGTNIPENKRIIMALGYLYGVGPALAKSILKEAGIDASVKTKDLSPEQTSKIREIIEKKYRVEGDLRREVRAHIKRLIDIGSYRGQRHIRHLPTRGQRTKTNTRTVRGNVRKTVGSGRKKSAEKT